MRTRKNANSLTAAEISEVQAALNHVSTSTTSSSYVDIANYHGAPWMCNSAQWVLIILNLFDNFHQDWTSYFEPILRFWLLSLLQSPPGWPNCTLPHVAQTVQLPDGMGNARARFQFYPTILGVDSYPCPSQLLALGAYKGSWDFWLWGNNHPACSVTHQLCLVDNHGQ